MASSPGHAVDQLMPADVGHVGRLPRLTAALVPSRRSVNRGKAGYRGQVLGGVPACVPKSSFPL